MPYTGIVGQERAIAVLRRVSASGKVGQAYLFTGVEGCGRRQTALAFIEALYCGRDEGCGHCASCRKLAAGNHPDLHQVQPDGAFIKIDQVRELQRELSLRPFEASRKACIVEGKAYSIMGAYNRVNGEASCASPTPTTEQSRHIGTTRMTASGNVQLSYCAASTRNTNTTANAKKYMAVLPAWRCR